ncbi:unnamed protein product [Aphanomyces euteiches]
MLLREVVYRVVYPVNTGTTKRAFISFWCGLIRSVLDFVIAGKSDRDTLPSEEPYRPDYLFLVDSVAVFRGEEEDPGKQIAVARQKLTKKIVWTYGEAPYLLLYAKDRLEAVYDVLERHDVPHVDSLVRPTAQADSLVFKPCGDDRKPTNLAELFDALGNVLEALVKLHAASWMHRDIRWPNVMKRRDAKSWFLIDFMDAAHSPEMSSSRFHLSHEEHAPEIFQEDGYHTIAVDVWAVGRLIETCGQETFDGWYDQGKERTQFVNHLMNDDPSKRPTAGAALDQLRQLEEGYTRQQRRLKGTKKQRRTEQH